MHYLQIQVLYQQLSDMQSKSPHFRTKRPPLRTVTLR